MKDTDLRKFLSTFSFQNAPFGFKKQFRYEEEEQRASAVLTDATATKYSETTKSMGSWKPQRILYPLLSKAHRKFTLLNPQLVAHSTFPIEPVKQ